MLLQYGSPDTQLALTGLRDLTTLEWYVIPFLAIIFYIYAKEIKKARKTNNWRAIVCGLTVFGMDFWNETWNGWVAWFTQYQGFWTTPGPTALRVTVGWNIEIIFMFLINGMVFAYMLEDDPKKKILGINNQWFWAIGLAAFCVFIECMLNIGGKLTWVYPWWNLSWTGVWLIFVFGYLEFYVACILVMKIKTLKVQFIAIGCIYAVPIIMNIIAAITGMLY